MPSRRILLALLAVSPILLAGVTRGAAEKRPHVVLVVGESHHYESGKSLRWLARELETNHGMRCTVLEVEGYTDLPGVEALDDADLAVFFIRRRLLRAEQMRHIRGYLDAGKPLVAFRTSSHAFAPRGKDVPEGTDRWDTFDQEVLGCHYAGHGRGETKVSVAADAKDHPILRGVEGPYRLKETLYRSRPLKPGCTLLMVGESLGTEMPEQPVAWTHAYHGGRVFYTSMGHAPTFGEAWFQRLVINAVTWALGREVPAE